VSSKLAPATAKVPVKSGGDLGRDGREQRGEPAAGWLSLAFLALGPGAVAA
jgi:hypothetical protein